MAKRPLSRSLDDIICEMTSRSGSQREAALQTIRDIENGDLIFLDFHQNPWASEQVERWIVSVLRSLANWKPGVRPPSLMFGAADYLKDLRFCRIEQKGSARAGAGRPAKFDWGDAEQCAIKLLDERGDPTDPLNQVDGWRSKSDLAQAVLEYLEKRAAKNGDAVPDVNTVRNKVPAWLESFHARN